MKELTVQVKDELGLHARPAAMLAKIAASYQSQVTMEANGKVAGVRDIMQMLALGVMQGDAITVTVEGTDEEQVISEMKTYLAEHL